MLHRNAGRGKSQAPNKISPRVSSHDRLETCRVKAQRALNAYKSLWTPTDYGEPLASLYRSLVPALNFSGYLWLWASHSLPLSLRFLFGKMGIIIIIIPPSVGRMKKLSRSVMSNSLQPHRLYSPWNSPGEAAVGSRSLLPSPGDLPNPGIELSHIAGGFFTSWATREAQEYWVGSLSHLPSPGDLPNPGIKLSHITGRFFTSWAIRESQEYWGGEPIPSPGIFLIQESNQGLLHCR